MRYQCFFVNDAEAVEKTETAEFDDERQARLWAEGLAANAKAPMVVELWAPPDPVARFRAPERAPGSRAAAARSALRRLSALFKGWTGVAHD